MKLSVYQWLLIIAILCCSQNEKNVKLNQPNTTSNKAKDSITKTIRKAPIDTIVIENGKKFSAIKVYKLEGKVCFSYQLDSIFKENQEILNFNIKDFTNKMVFFIGFVRVNKLNKNKYEFICQGNLPLNGNWKNLKSYDLMRHVLEINKDHYIYYEDKSYHKIFENVGLDKKIKVLEKQIYQDTTCLTDNWDHALQCFEKIKKYEHFLLLSSLKGNKQSIDKFLQLKENISIANAGEFSEYHTGNILLLSLYGILNKEQFNPDRYFNEWKSDSYCY